MEVLRRLRLKQNKKKEKKEKAWGLYMRNTGHTPEPGIGLSMSAGGRDLYSSFRLGMGDMNDTEKHINDMVYTLGRGGLGLIGDGGEQLALTVFHSMVFTIYMTPFKVGNLCGCNKPR